MTTETANVHFDVFGHRHLLPLEFELGPQPAKGILPFARRLTEQLTKLSIEHAEQGGKTISCRAGCGACCRQLVVITLVEAEELARVVAEMPAERQQLIRARFAAAIAQLEQAGLLDAREPHGLRSLQGQVAGSEGLAIAHAARNYFQQQIACPFLDNESCGIYADRPLVCREYHVTSPAADCARLYQIGVERVETPVSMGGFVARTLHHLANAPLQMIPLVLSLEWAESQQGRAEPAIDGLTLVQTLVTEIGRGEKPAPS
jgi:Fe-S-cluster containining protein